MVQCGGACGGRGFGWVTLPIGVAAFVWCAGANYYGLGGVFGGSGRQFGGGGASESAAGNRRDHHVGSSSSSGRKNAGISYSDDSLSRATGRCTIVCTIRVPVKHSIGLNYSNEPSTSTPSRPRPAYPNFHATLWPAPGHPEHSSVSPFFHPSSPPSSPNSQIPQIPAQSLPRIPPSVQQPPPHLELCRQRAHTDDARRDPFYRCLLELRAVAPFFSFAYLFHWSSFHFRPILVPFFFVPAPVSLLGCTTFPVPQIPPNSPRFSFPRFSRLFGCLRILKRGCRGYSALLQTEPLFHHPSDFT